MGMDVYGNKDGAYFRRNIWGWRPLAELVCKLEPELTADCTHWYCNSGDGLKARACRQLAKSLQAQIASDRVARLLVARNKAMAAMKDEACLICSGTSVRSDELGNNTVMTSALSAPTPEPIQTIRALVKPAGATAAMVAVATDLRPLTIHSPSKTSGSSPNSSPTAAALPSAESTTNNERKPP